MHFGENQLSRSLIGLSPLPTGHPPGFQPWWVRSSTRSYPRFNLPMGRSLRFGSTTCDSDALFRLAFATATPPGFTRNFTGSVLLGIPLESRLSFAYGGITHCADAFQRLPLPKRFVTLCQISSSS